MATTSESPERRTSSPEQSPGNPAGRAQRGFAISDFDEFGGNPGGREESAGALSAVFWTVLLLATLGGLVYLAYHPAAPALAAPGGPEAGGIAAWLWSLSATLGQSGIAPHLPWILGATALLALLGLLLSVSRQTRRRRASHFHSTRRVEGEVDGLLNDLLATANQAFGASEDLRKPIAGWRAGNAAQTEELASAIREISSLAAALERLGETASQATRQARESAQTAHKGVEAARDAMSGMDTTRKHIADAAEQLAEFGEGARRIAEIAGLSADATEQINVIALDASIQAARAGGGRGFAAAEEVRRLADRATRRTAEIIELTRHIRGDADDIIAALKTTAEAGAAGATLTGEAGRALGEIENAVRALAGQVELAANEAAGARLVAQTVGQRMDGVKNTVEQSDESLSQAALGVEKTKAVAAKLEKLLSAFTSRGR